MWQSCDIVVSFKNMAKQRLCRQEAKENDWSLLEAMFGQCLPMQFRNVMGDASLENKNNAFVFWFVQDSQIQKFLSF